MIIKYGCFSGPFNLFKSRPWCFCFHMLRAKILDQVSTKQFQKSPPKHYTFESNMTEEHWLNETSSLTVAALKNTKTATKENWRKQTLQLHQIKQSLDQRSSWLIKTGGVCYSNELHHYFQQSFHRTLDLDRRWTLIRVSYKHVQLRIRLHFDIFPRNKAVCSLVNRLV